MNPTEILNPTIFYAGWEIREPVTSATDLLVSIVAGIALWRLWRIHQQQPSPSLTWLLLYFTCLAVGMACASILGHLFQAYVPWETKAIGWIFSAIGMAGFEMSSLVQARSKLPKGVQQALQGWILLHHGLFFLAMAFPETRVFSTVKLNSTMSLVVTVLPLQAFWFWQTRSEASRWFVIAVAFGIFPALVYNLELSLSHWFNYHDISHVLMATYCYLVYQGGKRIPHSPPQMSAEPILEMEMSSPEAKSR